VKIRQTFESFFASKDLIEKTAKSFRHAWPLIRNADARVVAILVIERTKDGNLRVIDIAAQLCSKALFHATPATRSQWRTDWSLNGGDSPSQCVLKAKTCFCRTSFSPIHGQSYAARRSGTLPPRVARSHT